jgi:AraC family transcriptional regulator, alkane utilization regulator
VRAHAYLRGTTRSMPGTPHLFAGTSERLRGSYDLLAETLRAVRLTGSVFLNARFTEPFGVMSPKRYDERTPMAHLSHVIPFPHQSDVAI